MKNYLNLNGNSGVRRYEIGADYIRVEFNDYSVYKYAYTSAGVNNIEQAKKLAVQGYGLNSFIILNMRDLYSQKQ